MIRHANMNTQSKNQCFRLNSKAYRKSLLTTIPVLLAIGRLKKTKIKFKIKCSHDIDYIPVVSSFGKKQTIKDLSKG